VIRSILVYIDSPESSTVIYVTPMTVSKQFIRPMQ